MPAGMFADSGCYPTVYTMGDEIVISDLKDCKINDNLSYEFKGWYLDSNCTIPLVDNTISDQMEVSVLYAKLAMWVKG